MVFTAASPAGYSATSAPAAAISPAAKVRLTSARHTVGLPLHPRAEHLSLRRADLMLPERSILAVGAPPFTGVRARNKGRRGRRRLPLHLPKALTPP